MNGTSGYSTMGGARLLAAYLGDIKFEFVKMARTPAFAVPTLVFPAMFYLLFGVIMGRGDPTAGLHTFARLGVFGTMAPGLFGFGVSLAFEREYGLLTLKQALPTPPGSYLLARMSMAMLFASVISVLLTLLALFAAHAPLTAAQALEVFLIEVLGVLPFCAIGLMVGSLVSGQAAPAVVNLIYLPMAFLSGLWVPFQYLPVEFLKQIAPLWPSYHLSQIALAAVGLPSYGSFGGHVLVLLGITALFFTIAMRRLSNGGLHLFGVRRDGGGFPLRKAVTAVSMWVAIGLIVAGILGGNALQGATRTAAASNGAQEPVPDASGSAAPVGVAAPDTPVIADFDADSARASFGLGFDAADDKRRGGNSSVTQKIVAGGAADSRGALEVSGNVGSAIQYPFAGTAFLPNGTPHTEFAKQGYMDFSNKQRLRFFARGDGQTYTVLLMGPALDAIPAMYSFTPGEQWQEVTVPLRELGGLDVQRVKLICFGAMNPGPFRFQIDGVRVE